MKSQADNVEEGGRQRFVRKNGQKASKISILRLNENVYTLYSLICTMPRSRCALWIKAQSRNQGSIF